MSNIYINKKQMSILALGLMTLTRDDDAFEFGIASGAFKEDDIYEYIETIQNFVKQIEDCDGAMLSTEIDIEEFSDIYCVDLWGNTI